MSKRTLRVTHTMWTEEQWEKATQQLARMWHEADEQTRRAMIGDLVAHSGDLAFKDNE